jgi:hypothetical protein
MFFSPEMKPREKISFGVAISAYRPFRPFGRNEEAITTSTKKFKFFFPLDLQYIDRYVILLLLIAVICALEESVIENEQQLHQSQIQREFRDAHPRDPIFFRSAAHGDAPTIHHVLDEDISMANFRGNRGWTMLLYAASNGHFQLAAEVSARNVSSN